MLFGPFLFVSSFTLQVRVSESDTFIDFLASGGFWRRFGALYGKKIQNLRRNAAEKQCQQKKSVTESTPMKWFVK